MKYLIAISFCLLLGCSSTLKKESKACCSDLGIDLSTLIGENGIDCGGTREFNYWWPSLIKSKHEIERKNRASLACVKNALKNNTPFIYKNSFVSFPDGGYDYFSILTKEGQNVLIVHGSIGDEPLNYYIGYCEKIEIENSGRLSYKENQCSKTTDEALYESIKIK